MAEQDVEGQYGLELPDEDTVSERFRYLTNYWINRNNFIKTAREANAGLNMIEAPVSAQYKVKTVHSYTLAALMNEKTSRYSQLPVIQVIPDDDLDEEGRSKSTRIERALNIGAYEIERQSDGDVWSRVVEDAHFLDEGVEQVVRAENAFWTDLVTDNANGGKLYPFMEPDGAGSFKPGAKREAYKKTHGVPIYKRYVPLENFYPMYDGPTLIEAFDVEVRSVRSVRNNKLFQTPEGLEALRTIPDSKKDGGISAKVQIVQYVNSNWHCYYLASSTNNFADWERWPQVHVNQPYNGKLKLLYCYEHKLGRSLYNCVGGRFGGWKTSVNRIEGVGKGLLELAQADDELISQVATNVRAKYWPNLNFKMDPNLRGYGTGASAPDAPAVKEGEPIVTFIGEEILPIFKSDEDPMTMWLHDTIQGQIGKLGGSSVLFGGRSPGVDTGYHQALQTTQAESLDEKVEQHISAGATQEATIFLLHCKALNERVYMHYVEQDTLLPKKTGKYVYLDPEDLTPLPRMDAQVRKPRPMDYIAALRAAKEASDDRQGKGPLLSDDTIRQDILNVQGPDIEVQKIEIEAQKREIAASGVLSAKIGERINIKLAKNGIPSVSPEMIQKADPALVASIQQLQPVAAGMGGTSPKLLGDVAGAAGLPPGPMPGDPEENNRLGEAVNGLVATGTSSI